jgi:SPP1 gp7 family putative phage head morphogenesis protein
MSYQDEARKVLNDYLDKLGKQEKREMLLLANQWGSVSKELDKLIKKLAEAEFKTENELFKLDLYKSFLVQSKQQANHFAELAGEIISDNQKIFAEAGIESTQEVIKIFNVRFNHLPLEAVNNMIGISQNGSPLYELLKKSYPKTVNNLTHTLINSIALGRNPIQTARLMKADMGGNLTRALVIARTEQMNIFRETSLMQMRKSGVVNKWEWLAEKNACEKCLANNGKEFDLDESMNTHPNCRCAELPIVEVT